LRAPIERETAQDRVRANRLDYTEFSKPILLMAGAEDKLKPPGYARELALQIPGAEAAEIESAGHCPNIENPTVALEVILDYLVRNG
jgi:pimeloyl-ACP methyl ester carboxylesterase